MDNVAYNRAAHLAKRYAGDWEPEARADPTDVESTDLVKLKAGHWCIIEKEIRGLVRQSEAKDKRQ